MDVQHGKGEVTPNAVVNSPEGLVYLYNGDAGFATSDPLLPGIRHRLLQPKTGPWQYLCEC